MTYHEAADPSPETPRFKEILDLGLTPDGAPDDPEPASSHEELPPAAGPRDAAPGPGAVPYGRGSAAADPAAVGRVAAVTGAVVLLLLVLAATGALIFHALPLAGVALAGGALFYAGFTAPTGGFGRWARVGFAITACVFCAMAYSGWQGKRPARGLAHIITPVPDIERVTQRPPGQELMAALALSATLDALDGAWSRQLAGQPPDTAQRGFWARLVRESNQRYWVVETDLGVPQVMEFYARPEHRAGWTVAAERPEGLLSLRRGAEELLIMASDGTPRARSRVAYLYVGESGDE